MTAFKNRFIALIKKFSKHLRSRKSTTDASDERFVRIRFICAGVGTITRYIVVTLSRLSLFLSRRYIKPTVTAAGLEEGTHTGSGLREGQDLV